MSKTIVFLKTIRTASTNNLGILRRLAAEKYIDKTYCVAEVDKLNTDLETAYISNQHSTALRSKERLDSLSPEIWTESTKVTSIRNPWDQAISAFWRTFVGTPHFTLDKSNINRINTFSRKLNSQENKCVSLAKSLFNDCLSVIGGCLSKKSFLQIEPRDMEVTGDAETDRLYRDLLFSLQRTINVLMIDGQFVADYHLRYEHFEQDWKQLLKHLNVDYQELLSSHAGVEKGPIKNDLGNDVPKTWGSFSNFMMENKRVTRITNQEYSYTTWYNNTQDIILRTMGEIINKFNYNF